MKKLLAIALLLMWTNATSGATNRYVKASVTSGDTFATVGAAFSAGSAGDTVNVRGKVIATGSISPGYANLTLRGRSPAMDTIESTVNHDCLYQNQNGFTLSNLHIRWQNSATIRNAFAWLYIAEATVSGCIVKDCVFWTDSIANTYARGVRHYRNGTYPAVSNIYTRSRFHGFGNGGFTPDWGTKIDSCVFDKAHFSLSNKVKAAWAIVKNPPGEITATAGMIDAKVSYSVLDSFNGEQITFDETDGYHSSDTIERCLFIRQNHVAIMADWDSATTLRYNDFTRSTDGSGEYIHANKGTQFSKKNYFSYNNTYDAPSAAFNAATTATTNDSLLNVYFNRSLFLGTGIINAGKSRNSVADSCVWIGNPTHTGLTANTSSTINFSAKSHLLDSVFGHWHTWSSPQPYAGAKKYLTNKIDTLGQTRTSIQVIDSLAYDYRLDNFYYDTGFTYHNTWYTGDTAKTYLQKSTNKTLWTNADSSTKRAGKRDTMTANNLPAGKIFYRLLTVPLGGFMGMKSDTMPIDSIVMAGESSRVSKRKNSYNYKYTY